MRGLLFLLMMLIGLSFTGCRRAPASSSAEERRAVLQEAGKEAFEHRLREEALPVPSRPGR